MKKPTFSDSFLVYASLPFVELAKETSIHIGPVIFWPASKFEQFIPSEFQPIFQNYLETIAQIKAPTDNGNHLINTVKLAPEGTTYISIKDTVPLEHREELLIDSLYLLYFVCTFRNLYYNHEFPSFGAFRKIIPASLDFVQHKQNWENLHIQEIDREDKVCIHLIDKSICQSFGEMLSKIYSSEQNYKINGEYKRIIRGIRYLVDRFFQRFVNLFNKGLSFPEFIFEPEDVIFLASSFESLFDINDRHAASDFKHKLRPLLHLKYSTPVEIFWKWVDDFYEVRRKIVHGGQTPDPTFRLNPNFEVSHILIGIKLFIYSTYYILFKQHLISSQSSDPYTPPDFKWIHPEEILLFFWTEKSLLNKLGLFLSRVIEEKDNQEMYADIHLLANLFIAMQERYYQNMKEGEIKFIPTPIQEIEPSGRKILHLLNIIQNHPDQFDQLIDVLPHQFQQILQHRLQPQKPHKKARIYNL